MAKDGVIRSIEEIYKLNTQERKSNYEAIGISKVTIDNNTYTNYGAYQFILEKTYVKSPVRSADGSIRNLNSYSTFLTPHLIINFSLMSIDDYRSIMRQHYSKNEFTVTCYDVIHDKEYKAKMYFGTEEMAKLHTIANKRLAGNGQWEEWVDLVGVEGYTVELIGTNNDLDTVSVVYHLNPPADTGYADQVIGEEDVVKGGSLVIGRGSTFQEETFNEKYKFAGWNISPSGGETGNYVDGNEYIINSELILYAQWQSMEEHTLNFSYGLSEPMIENGKYVYSRKVVKGQSIGTLPTFESMPQITYKENTYRPYYDGGWYKTATKVLGQEVTNNEPYWSDYSTTIYLHYSKALYRVYFEIQNENELEVNPIDLSYGDVVPLASFIKTGYTFDGWYLDNEYKEKFSGTMPPYSIRLYARWVENK